MKLKFQPGDKVQIITGKTFTDTYKKIGVVKGTSSIKMYNRLMYEVIVDGVSHFYFSYEIEKVNQ